MPELVVAAEHAPVPFEVTPDIGSGQALMEFGNGDDEQDLPVAMQVPCPNENELVKENWGLVRVVAWRYRNQGMPLEDLEQEGGIGLVRALRTHDPARGELSTHATNLIKRAILAAFYQQARTIRLPRGVYEAMWDMNTVQEELRGSLHREPSEAELAEKLNTTPKQIAALRMAWTAVISLDKEASASGSFIPSQRKATVGDMIQAPYRPNLTDTIGDIARLIQQEKRRVVNGLLGQLSLRDADMIRALFGLSPYKHDHGPHEVAQLQDVTVKNIWDRRRKALLKMRRLVGQQD